MSNLTKRNGVYHYDVTIKGVRKRGSTGLKDKYLAGLFVNDLITKARTAGIQSLLRESPVLKDFAVEFLQWVEDTHSIEFGTRRYYKNGWRLLKDTVLTEKRLDTINNHVCETVTFPGGPTTANAALRTLRRMLGKAKEMGKFWGDFPEIKLRKERERAVAMSIEDATLIASKMEQGDAKDALLVLRGTGMRPKETFSMRWEFMNFPNSTYHNPHGKTKTANRVVPLLYESAMVLKRRHLEQGFPSQGWVFPADSGSGHMVTIYKAFTKARKAAGFPDEMCPYTARHGMMTDLSQVLSLREVMQIGGHGDCSTALRYQHPKVEEIGEKLLSKRIQ